jgi:uncharacterized protein DUF3617
MTSKSASVAILTLVLSWSVLAQGPSPMREGNWEVTMKMNMPGMGMDLPPMKQTQCVTAAMIKDPQKAMPTGPGQGDCKVTNYKLTGSTATYTMACKEPPMTAEGVMRYSGTDAYTGTLKIDMGGQPMTIEYDSKRIGDCPK